MSRRDGRLNMGPRPVPPAAPELPGGLLMPSAPAEAAEAAAGGDLDVRRDVGGAAPPPQPAPQRRQCDQREVRPEQALAQRAHARQPRSGGLEIPPCGELHAERRAPAEPWAVVSR